MADRLEARVALVTGGCSGIGLATVELFIAEGASVVIADVQDEKGAALEMRFSGRAIYRHCDVTREADIEAAVAAAKESFGGLDILFNNAGAGGVRAGIADMPVDGWDETQALLLRGPMLGMKHAVPLMIERGGGSIINTASIAGSGGMGACLWRCQGGRHPSLQACGSGTRHSQDQGQRDLSRRHRHADLRCIGRTSETDCGSDGGRSCRSRVADAAIAACGNAGGCGKHRPLFCERGFKLRYRNASDCRWRYYCGAAYLLGRGCLLAACCRAGRGFDEQQLKTISGRLGK